MTDALWSGVVALVASAIGGLGALAGGFLSSWQARKQLDRQLEHASETWLRQERRIAYVDFLIAVDSVNIASFKRENKGNPLFAEVQAMVHAGQRVRLIAPPDTEARIGPLVSATMTVAHHPDEAGPEDVRLAREAFFSLAKRDVVSLQQVDILPLRDKQ